ncbi:vanadium-dependent haloperoxidase [Hymenobacter sp. PAMC 26628]|uniref:vanadium-dependent haloperoxidase n=1 Tax=Hymenobacter sp. PAMC 26628 TaxID=1484118 RepID=UPI000770692B|nr:vanadium-dependent haloperoxidase [Hymenobacter sp. PAMC 26628]AMJ65666.1 hypothetical protein AXW84_09670 [Hymenobacter sp. PAMC 26628]
MKNLLLLSSILPLAAGIVLATSCQKDVTDTPPAAVAPTAVLAWNQAATVAVTRLTNPATGFFLLPHLEARAYAIVNLAMYDALNNIQQKNAPYALQGPLVPTAAPDAAVAAAAHDALVVLVPDEKAYADSLYTATLAKIGDGTAKTQGVALGQAAAKAVLAKRANDGADAAQTPFPIGTNPGDYQYTPPFDGPPFNGYYALAGWKDVTPFVLTAANQFRPGPPPALTSDAYTADFNEVKAVGGATSATRTADQAASALFWLDNSPLAWFRVARAALATKPADAYATVRLLAQLQMAETDSYIAMCDAKYAYRRWRPITAVRLAATDGNPNTAPDAAWLPLAFPNPPDADYPSGHGSAGGAAAAVLQSFFGTDAVAFALTSNAGKTRSYTGFGQAAAENSLSRMYAGYHFRTSTAQGQAMGTQVGAFVVANALK